MQTNKPRSTAEHIQALRDTYERRLQVIEQQIAKAGPSELAGLTLEAEQIHATLRSLSTYADNVPTDQPIDRRDSQLEHRVAQVISTVQAVTNELLLFRREVKNDIDGVKNTTKRWIIYLAVGVAVFELFIDWLRRLLNL